METENPVSERQNIQKGLNNMNDAKIGNNSCIRRELNCYLKNAVIQSKKDGSTRTLFLIRKI